MNYQDDFSINFTSEDELHGFLEELEDRAGWDVRPSSSIRVLPAEENEPLCRQITERLEEKGIIKDTCQNTGLLLKMGRSVYPLGKSSLATLKSRARVNGNALSDLEKPKLARILNDCLKVTKGDALIRIQEGKVRAVHGGDENDYCILPMPEIFGTASSYINGKYDEAKFKGGYYDHTITTATWEIEDDELVSVYRDALKHYRQDVNDQLSAAIRISSSDVAASGANIYYSLLVGEEKRPLVLGKALKLAHEKKASMAKFDANMSMAFARYEEALAGLERLFHIYINHPVNVISGLMQRVKIGKKLIAETVEQFKAAYMGGTCTGYDVYCAICASLFLSEVNGVQGKELADLEESISRCLTLRWSDYDIPGELK
ncbi:endonuclease III [Enterocloster bolteae]|uniref:endonuclease III n=1 Tax=Enterocloster bolteae TaxID=208479 RepID=UPI0028DCCA21|nr:endonuclease III [Enterocloster bolteae]